MKDVIIKGAKLGLSRYQVPSYTYPLEKRLFVFLFQMYRLYYINHDWKTQQLQAKCNQSGLKWQQWCGRTGGGGVATMLSARTPSHLVRRPLAVRTRRPQSVFKRDLALAASQYQGLSLSSTSSKVLTVLHPGTQQYFNLSPYTHPTFRREINTMEVQNSPRFLSEYTVGSTWLS